MLRALPLGVGSEYLFLFVFKSVFSYDSNVHQRPRTYILEEPFFAIATEQEEVVRQGEVMNRRVQSEVLVLVHDSVGLSPWFCLLCR